MQVDLSVETFWVVYIVALLVIGVIVFILSRSGNVPLSAGFLAATIVSAAFVMVLIYFSVNDLELTDRDRQIINILYGVMGFLVLIAVFWVIFDLVSSKNKIKNVVSVECDEDVCTVKTRPVDYSDPSERQEIRNSVTAVCDEDGCHATGLTPKRVSTRMNVQFLT